MSSLPPPRCAAINQQPSSSVSHLFRQRRLQLPRFFLQPPNSKVLVLELLGLCSILFKLLLCLERDRRRGRCSKQLLSSAQGRATQGAHTRKQEQRTEASLAASASTCAPREAASSPAPSAGAGSGASYSRWKSSRKAPSAPLALRQGSVGSWRRFRSKRRLRELLRHSHTPGALPAPSTLRQPAPAWWSAGRFPLDTT